MRVPLLAALSLLIPLAASAQTKLLSPSLDNWEKVGDGLWSMMRDGTLVGQRDLKVAVHQAWLYSKKEYGEFDLHVEWWTRWGGNSGVSLRDTSRGKWSGKDHDPVRTPSHIGYEIQISNGYDDKYPTGSVYLFDKAKTGFQILNDWNTFDIESRNEGMKVKLNGHLVSEYAGEPGRPKKGPIGLQLHDSTTVVMFRNITIREVGNPR